jgi:hypothetical protein
MFNCYKKLVRVLRVAYVIATSLQIKMEFISQNSQKFSKIRELASRQKIEIKSFNIFLDY